MKVLHSICSFEKNWSNKTQLQRITNQFVDLIQNLNKLGISHCDLQHGNILVKNDSIKLVDYDNMFVPEMAGQKSLELGHANYQHPQRSEADFGKDLDNFSAWIIYYSLYLLRLDSSLWQRFAGGDDCLLFRKDDFVNPDNSRILKAVHQHEIPDIRAQFQFINSLLRSSLREVKAFNPIQLTVDRSKQTGTFLTQSAKPPPVYPTKWPTIEEYFWSIVKPSKSFSDEKLKKSVPVPTEGKTSTIIEADATTQERLTVTKTVIRGNSHVIFHMIGENFSKHYAIKLFLNDLPDRHTRYIQIHRHNKKASGKYFVPFVYQQKGILVGSHWFPVLKMLWIQGETIDEYVSRHLELGYSAAVEELSPKFVAMINALSEDGIAHGDLEPSNILVDTQGNLKIIDYDTMYVPGLANLQSAEKGSRYFQHPERNLTNFGNYLDNYSTLAIYGILSCLSQNPPRKFWNWEALLKNIRSQPRALQAKQQSLIGGQKKTFADTLIKPQKTMQNSTTGELFNPVFEKVTHEDLKGPQTFESRKEKLAKVLSDQHKRRIDQISRLDHKMWNLA